MIFKWLKKKSPAITEGKLAFSNIVKIDANPYQNKDHALATEWKAGWEEASRARKKIETRSPGASRGRRKNAPRKDTQPLESVNKTPADKQKEVEDLVKMGEELLKSDEFVDPELRKIIEESIKGGKKALKDSKDES